MAVRNHVDNNLSVRNAVNQPVGLENYLSILLIANIAQFFGRRSAFGTYCQVIGGAQQAIENVFCAFNRIELRNIANDILNIGLCVRGQYDLVRHLTIGQPVAKTLRHLRGGLSKTSGDLGIAERQDL